MEKKMIPVSEPALGNQELEYVSECLKTGWISSAGHFIDEFEQGWADYCGQRFGVAVSNGSVALQAAVACMGLEPGSEVILPTFTIISCATAITYNQLKPVLVDSDSQTWCMDINQIESRITAKTRAIMPVHIYGHPVDMDPLIALAQKYDLKIIEDAAEAHGAEYKGRRCGSLGDISCFSFYANKIITTGEGGMLLTSDPVMAEKARSFRNLGFQPHRRFYHEVLGHNFRMTNLQAAIGLAQLGRVSQAVEKKCWIGRTYSSQLADINQIDLPVEKPWAKNVYWMYGIVLNESSGMDAAMFAKRLKKSGIETRPFFLGMHEQPAFRKMGLFLDEKYPVAERIARQGLYLPSGLTLTEDQIVQVVASVKQVLKTKG
jgi:perosamine synthetase